VASLIIRLLINMAALAAAAWLVDDIVVEGDTDGQKTIALLVTAVIFGIINVLIKPIVRLITLPLFVLTLGLITLVINALLLLLTSWLSEQLGYGVQVDGFWTAVLGALIVSIVSFLLSVLLPD
jgi:putative membrane protein